MNNRMLVTTALAAIMGLTALAPGAYAQSAPAAPDAPAVTQPDAKGPGPQGEHRGERGQRGGIAGLICSTDGATQLETRLADIATKLALTAEQQPLFDAYRTAALTAQTSFAESCATLQPATAPATAPDALTVLKDRQARQTAELDALNAVLPSFEALYNSLTDTQKATLQPLVGPHHGGEHGPRGDRAGRGDDHRGGEHDGGRGRDGRAGMIEQLPGTGAVAG
ncbi:Spy/CpxP family protein refolding chaperone [Devosia sp. Root105]|uniref:Spy/CpxP family protein refolding chaperone n=1 Tax=Devosia sp. Root105 TaxID=1736423 RepID=UPI0006F600F3|nr:Spy/CpxP family protein refolding chaperone [Devosia sp. Root105]KQU95259.1 hypothetical protein ASC68_19095 [Devosia sp. Root105]